jgi:ABC-type sugar transport system ATPase subunit
LPGWTCRLLAVVLNAGTLKQVDTSSELYERPQSVFVATFIGSPKMNLLKSRAAAAENAAIIGIRPEHIRIAPDGLWEARLSIVKCPGNENNIYQDSDLARSSHARRRRWMAWPAGPDGYDEDVSTQ